MGDPVTGKLAIGMGLGALGGALSNDPSELFSFAGARGNSGIPGIGSGGMLSVDPGDLLAQGLGRNQLAFNALAQRANQPVTLGPASIVQTPQFAFGGALPAPLGFTVSDPGFKELPGFDIFGGQPPPDLTSPGDTGLNDDPHDRDDPILSPGGPSPGGPSTGGPFPGMSMPSQQQGQPSFMSLASRGGLPAGNPMEMGGIGAQPAGMNRFITAMNLLSMANGQRPMTPGGFS